MLAGRRQIFVRLAGCNLDCRYCDTKFEKIDSCRLESKPGSGQFIELAQPIPLKKIMDVIAEWQALLPGTHHSISFTGGEPLIEADSLAEWFPEIRNLLPIHLETNGTMNTALKSIINYVDFISMDMKLPSTSGCDESLWESHELFMKQAIGSNLSVKIVVGDSTVPAEINRVCDIISSVESSTPLFLQPLTLPDGAIGISGPHLLLLQELASSRVPDVRVIPQMHKLLRLQ